MPYVSHVSVGRRKQRRIFGGDWPTVDGTGVRDYIHVMDLARAHADAIDYLVREGRGLPVHLRTGRGVSVLELVRAFAEASGRELPYEILPPRPRHFTAVSADPCLPPKPLVRPASV